MSTLQAWAFLQHTSLQPLQHTTVAADRCITPWVAVQQPQQQREGSTNDGPVWTGCILHLGSCLSAAR